MSFSGPYLLGSQKCEKKAKIFCVGTCGIEKRAYICSRFEKQQTGLDSGCESSKDAVSKQKVL